MGTLLDTASAWFIRALEFIMVIMMIGMLILVGLNVGLRIGFNTASTTPKKFRASCVHLADLLRRRRGRGARTPTSIRTGVIVHMVPRPVQKLFYAITQILILVCGGYITYGTWML